MKFQVPQFIETETKIIGPLTLRQFLFVAGGISMAAVAWILLDGIPFFIVAFLILAFFGGLAFAKIDDQPMLNYLAYALAYLLGAKQAVYKVPEQSDRFNLPGHGQ